MALKKGTGLSFHNESVVVASKKRRVISLIFAIVTAICIAITLNRVHARSLPRTVNLGTEAAWYNNQNYGCLWLKHDAGVCMAKDAQGKWLVVRNNLKLEHEETYAALSECINSTAASPTYYAYLTSNPDGLVWSNPLPYPGTWFYCRLDGSQSFTFPHEMPFAHQYIDGKHFISLPIRRKTGQNYIYEKAIIFDGHKKTIVPIVPEIPYTSGNAVLSAEGYIVTHSWAGFWTNYPFITIQIYKGGRTFAPFKQFSIKIPDNMDVCNLRFSPSAKQVAFFLAKPHTGSALLAKVYDCVPRLRPTGQDFSLWIANIDGSHMRCIDDSVLTAQSVSKLDTVAFKVSGSLQWTLDENGIVFLRGGNVYEVLL